MPSGSKRRKAAKKKKERQAPISDPSSTNTNSSNAQENDEVRSQDEKDSEGGEPNSPGSHDHHGPFNGGSEELGKSDSLPVASADVENKPVYIPVDSDAAQKIEIEGNGGVETVKDVKFEDDSPIPIECVEPGKSDPSPIALADVENKPMDIPVDSDGVRKIGVEGNGGVETVKEEKFDDDFSIPIECVEPGSEELGKSDPSPVASADVENKPVDIQVDSNAAQKVGVEGNGGVETIKELKFEDDFPIPIECVEPGSEELGKSDPSPVASADVENKPVDIQVDSNAAQKVEVEGNGGVETIKELKFEDDFPIPIECVEPVKEQHYEGTEKSSIIRPDGESLVTDEEKFGVEEGSKNLEMTEFEDLEKPGESLPQKLTKVIDGGLDEGVNVAEPVVSLSQKVIDFMEAAPSENKADFGLNSRGKEDLLTSIDEVQQVAPNGSASNNVGAKVFPLSVDNSGVESGAVTSFSKEKDGELLPSSGVLVTQTHNGTEKAKNFEVSELNNGLESASNNVGANMFPVSVENSGVESGALTSVSKEKEGEILATRGVLVAQTHSGTEKAKDFEVCEPNNGLESASNNVRAEVFPVTVEDSVIESVAVASVSKEKEGELLPPSGVLVSQTHNSTEKAKDFEVCESSEDQPLVAPAPRIVEKTSWMSCCGLFDIFMGSSR
ncbi:uncharacterized protein LOC104440829 [Eucalyptus grandis]|uniref:uncharacterized protein LOC104440829 n=1 Tax=Eucalyptus grandis TaxID=71139 RepID=UPI00192EC70D|nr:uncharacterized protein LOC104440829 [Eucalyptus grandis]